MPIQRRRQHQLSRLALGERFVDVFDFGDDWTHLSTVGPERVDPLEALGIVPDEPLPYFGWGDIPDQYRRRWDDDGESPQPRLPRVRIRHFRVMAARAAGGLRWSSG